MIFFMSDQIIYLIIIFILGIIASFINVMAGGGSVLTLGGMMLMGMDASIANGTNRVGVFIGAASSTVAYRAEKISNIKKSLILGLCALPGAIIGTFFAIDISNELFKKLLSIVMIFVLITLFVPKKKDRKKRASKVREFMQYPAMVLVGLYGGFIQAGVGFLIMAALRHLTDMTLVRVNMHKAFIVLIYTVPVLIIFSLSGNINWLYASILSAGNFIGAWLSVKLSVKKGDRVVKYVLCLAIVIMVVKFFMD